MKIGFGKASLLFLALFITNCSYQVNPTTGKRELYKKTWSKERKEGQRIRNALQTEAVLLKQKKLIAYVNNIAKKVGKHTPFASEKLHKYFPDFNPTVDIVYSETIAAFSIPPMHIVITSGLLAQLQNEAQFAYVISHELAHLAKRPFADRAIQWRKKRRPFLDLNDALETALKLKPMFPTESSFIPFNHIEYSLETEKEVHDLAVFYAANAGYETSELQKVATLLKNGVSNPSVFSPYPLIHPIISTSEKKTTPQLASFWIEEEQEPILREESYLKAINGLPIRTIQHGFKNGKLVVHPRLGYQFAAAEAWNFTSTKDRMLLVNDDETALLTTLFFKKEGTISARIYALFAQAGLSAENTSPITLNGRNRFQASATTLYKGIEYSLVAGAIELDAIHVVVILLAETDRFDAFKPYFTESYTTLIPFVQTDTTYLDTNFLKLRVTSNSSSVLADSLFSDFANPWVSSGELFRLNQKSTKDSLLKGSWIKTLQGTK